jgi:predicted lipoprotein with Yx(FWY)xxD motif
VSRIPVRTTTRSALVGAALAATAALTACSSEAPTGSYYGSGSAPAAGQQLRPPTQTILSANSTAQLGTVVIDGLGFTLYRSDADSAKPPTAKCDDDCARDWPPVVAEGGEPVLEGVDPEDVGTVTREDGTEQVTIGGWPVYRCAADGAPGATDCHGEDGWFAVTPTGEKAEKP